VEVTLTGSDNLSGVTTTWYTVDDGEAQVYKGPFQVSAQGTTRIVYWSEDAAGNREMPGAPLELRLDSVAPVTTLVAPVAPASGWFSASELMVAFAVGDALSGVHATYFAVDEGEPVLHGAETTVTVADGRHTLSYWSVDIAGNTETPGPSSSTSTPPCRPSSARYPRTPMRTAGTAAPSTSPSPVATTARASRAAPATPP
jgi:hypothetical protein